ncbi:hypothetical protein HYG86_14740 [Alkalicella caledoniensis]|uniref:Dual OB-containing domain-containing protein n=1 Tax=Alkalicella caledoniensis TaxID=2731377 RepID=A0A7G9WB72_ALKCA|nr:hypothetical protein [Alkalicella caledoniensis]QNO15934.1 hypothetical protein HYG86_14740 [Alkalicella caledoniensis]
MEKEIIVLAKSSKQGEYCIAGIDTSTGEWIRPISNNAAKEGSVPIGDITYENGTQVEILDKVRIRFSSHAPSRSQPENYIYDSSYYWSKEGRYTFSQVLNIRGYDKPEMIFYNAYRRVPEVEIGGEPSLLLVNIQEPTVVINTDGFRRKISLNFVYNNTRYYDFSISDSYIKGQYNNHRDGCYPIGRDLTIVFSLTDVFMGYYYKMAAQIFLNH